jgi:hypothetical protein
MPKKSFTQKEKVVFYGMIKYPNLNDNVLSDIIDINPSTIATIRNKFKKNDLFKTVRVPFLEQCGFELFSISYDRLYFPSLSESPHHILNNIYKRIPNIFYLFNAPDSWLSMGYYQNYMNFKRINEIVRYNKYQFNFQEDTETQVLFPFGLTKFYNFFDYSQIIKNFFELDIDRDIEFPRDDKIQLEELPGTKEPDKMADDKPKPLTDPAMFYDNLQYPDEPLTVPQPMKFSKAEREVFLALMQYPEHSDFAINKIISISATSINNIRKKFESKRIIKQCIIPNLSLLGFELITLSHMKFRSIGNLHVREKLIGNIFSKVPSILYVSNNTDEIILAAYKNFSEYQHINEELTKLYRDKNILAIEPRTLLFPLTESIIIKEHSYVPMVNQLLGRGKSIINAILEIIGNKLGDTGKQIFIKHLDSMDIMADELTVKDIPKLIEIIQVIITPIFGAKSVDEITAKVKQLEGMY